MNGSVVCVCAQNNIKENERKKQHHDYNNKQKNEILQTSSTYLQCVSYTGLRGTR